MSKIAVSTRFRKPVLPWRSVVLRIPNNFDPQLEYIAVTMRRVLKQLSNRLGLPKHRTRTVILTGGPKKGCFGYLRIYQGKPTPEEATLFRKARLLASQLNGKDIRQRPEKPST